jgi:hypothetical protein
MESVQLDCIYGNTQIDWLISKRITSIPSNQTWLLAAASRSIGMMIYLLDWGIACPNIDDVIQYATNKNHMDTLVFFTSPEFKFMDSDGIPLKTRFCPVIDKAVKKNHLELITYILWRFPNSRATMLKKPLPTLLYLMEHNLLSMFKKIVPAVTLVTTYSGLNVAATKGHKAIVKYAIDHLDPVYVSTTIPDDILVSAAKNGHLDILMILKRRKRGMIPVEAFQQAFSWGHVRVCKYIQKRFPHYLPTEKDLIDACIHGHHEVMSLVPEAMHIPSICIEKAAKSKNHRLIYVLKKKKPNYKFQPKILSDAIKSGSSDVCIAVFDCGHYNKLPTGCEVDMVSRRMGKALRIFHRLGFAVYTEDALLEAARICDLDLIKDILITGELEPSEKVVQEALSFIYVSSETTERRGEAFTFLDKFFAQTKKRSREEESDHNRTVRNDMTRAKRLKNIHHQSHE